MSKTIHRSRHQICVVVVLIVLITLIGRLALGHPSRSKSPVTTSEMTQASWSLTGSLNTARYAHTASVLANGKILVVGGESWIDGFFKGLLTSAELYDPLTAKWTITGSLNKARASHTATLLPNGKVLVVGGDGSTFNISSTSSTELYDPATGTWSVAGNLEFVRVGHTATLLPNGKALIVGGSQIRGQSAEVYDPVSATWSLTGLLNTLRQEFTATLLDSGLVLVTGGVGQFPGRPFVSGILDVAEVYNPATEAWSLAEALNHTRAGHSATLLKSGKVLLAGGYRGYEPLSDLAIEDDSLELYDPASGRWRIAGNRHFSGTATLLPGGQVLCTNGIGAELYDPETGTWSATASLNEPRSGHSTVLMPNGRVLVAGGNGSGGLLESAEIFDSGVTSSGSVTTASAASYHVNSLTAETIATSFGSELASSSVAADILPLPTLLGGTSIKVRDSAGAERLAPLFFVSPTQVNYQIPSGTAVGVASVTVSNGTGVSAMGRVSIRPVAPGLFSINQSGQGVAAALALRIRADGSQNYEVIAEFDELQKRFVVHPIDLGPESDRVFLILFGTGIRFRSSLSAVVAAIGGEFVEVTFAGAQPNFVGVDQVNLLLPRSLAGRGEMEITMAVDAQMANAVLINIK